MATKTKRRGNPAIALFDLFLAKARELAKESTGKDFYALNDSQRNMFYMQGRHQVVMKMQEVIKE